MNLDSENCGVVVLDSIIHGDLYFANYEEINFDSEMYGEIIESFQNYE